MSVEDLLATYDIPAIPMQLAKSAAEAVAISAVIGFPVVMKIAAAGISHKSDLGGVLLDIKDTSEVHNGYTKLMQAFNIQLPTAKIEGVYLQRQASPGQELILGAVRDPHFGPLIMFGSGGVEAECLPPTDPESLATLRQGATIVSVAAGETATLQLTMRK